MDLVVTGGCGPCDVLCRRSLLQDNAFNHEALMSKPMFESLFTGTSWDYSLSVPHLTLVGLSELNEWASRNIIVTAIGEEILQVFQIATNSLEDSSIPAADFNVFPEYTE
ncbi:hypothetical protein JG687_00019621, partial [Phytophthora cactorum]